MHHREDDRFIRKTARAYGKTLTWQRRHTTFSDHQLGWRSAAQPSNLGINHPQYSIMRTSISPLVVVATFGISFVLAPSVHATDQASYFPQGPEGWTILDSSGPTFSPQYNVDGFIEFTDVISGADFFFSAPASYITALHTASNDAVLDFDLLVDTTDTATYDAVAIISPTMTIVLPKPNPAANQWVHCSYTFRATEGWCVGSLNSNGTRAATDAEIQQVLATATALVIRGEWKTGADTDKLDNVRFTSNGAPATVTPSSAIERAIEVYWMSLPGSIYQVQWTDSLAPPFWQNLGSPIPGTGAEMSAFDSTRHATKRFYRVVVTTQ